MVAEGPWFKDVCATPLDLIITSTYQHGVHDYSSSSKGHGVFGHSSARCVCVCSPFANSVRFIVSRATSYHSSTPKLILRSYSSFDSVTHCQCISQHPLPSHPPPLLSPPPPLLLLLIPLLPFHSHQLDNNNISDAGRCTSCQQFPFLKYIYENQITV